MRLFASRRERRLWLWALAVAAAIYATLGLTGTLVGVLRAYGLLEAASVVGFVIGMFLVGAVVVTQGIKVRVGEAEIAVAVGLLAAYLLVFVRMTSLEERSHLIEYGAWGVFTYDALAERASRGRRVPVPPLLAVLATTALGVVDEGIQWFLPNRIFDPQDMLFNLLAGTMSIGSVTALAWARRRTTRARRGG